MIKKLAASIMVLTVALAVAADPEAGPRSATVPIALDHCRMTVEVVFTRTDGSPRPARAWVDSGGMAVVAAEALARELGIGPAAMPANAGQTLATTTPVPAMSLGGIPLAVEGMNLSVRRGRFAIPGVEAECVLPARCLRRLHVVFDYPAHRLTVALAGVLAPVGTAVPCRVNPETGLFMVEATLDGEKVALGIDNGSAGTWLSDKLSAAWLARHADWPHAVGAAGSTNFFGFPFETQGALLCLPALAIGSLPVARELAVLGLDQRLFDWYSQKSAGPVVGFLGAEFIARFRLEVDFPGQMTWWQPGPVPALRDLDIVGLTLRPENDGSFSVAGIVQRDGRPVVPGVQAGDRLLRVDGLDVAGATMGMVINALRGKPGARRVLLLERSGKPTTVKAQVVRLP
ncbi:MAG: hypothetical protein NTW95_12555 [Candidatus Aminicenantes bacterium]|nr:hypothetical protein [Candidatus Aminicenantes bacterium]